MSPADAGKAGCLLGAVIGAIVGVVLLGAAADGLRANRDLQMAVAAEAELASRVERLATLPLPVLPSDGVYGVDDALGPLTGLLVPEGPLSFRLEVHSDGSVVGAFAQFRLSCSWLSGRHDVVMFRSLEPVVRGGTRR